MHKPNLIRGLSVLLALLFVQSSNAFIDQSFGVGVGFYSQNIFNKTTKSANGETTFLGETNLPLTLKYDWNLLGDWFLAPQLGYTPIARKAAEGTASVTLMHLSFLFGQNFTLMGSNLDWYFGPGLMQETIKGAGGITQMNNGTGTANFAVPGSSATIRKVTTNLGTSITSGHQRVGLELTIENLVSNSKRAQSLMFSYSYLFGGGTY